MRIYDRPEKKSTLEGIADIILAMTQAQENRRERKKKEEREAEEKEDRKTRRAREEERWKDELAGITDRAKTRTRLGELQSESSELIKAMTGGDQDMDQREAWAELGPSGWQGPLPEEGYVREDYDTNRRKLGANQFEASSLTGKNFDEKGFETMFQTPGERLKASKRAEEKARLEAELKGAEREREHQYKLDEIEAKARADAKYGGKGGGSGSGGFYDEGDIKLAGQAHNKLKNSLVDAVAKLVSSHSYKDEKNLADNYKAAVLAAKAYNENAEILIQSGYRGVKTAEAMFPMLRQNVGSGQIGGGESPGKEEDSLNPAKIANMAPRTHENMPSSVDKKSFSGGGIAGAAAYGGAKALEPVARGVESAAKLAGSAGEKLLGREGLGGKMERGVKSLEEGADIAVDTVGSSVKSVKSAVGGLISKQQFVNEYNRAMAQAGRKDLMLDLFGDPRTDEKYREFLAKQGLK